MKIIINDNGGYKWHSKGEVFVKGYFQRGDSVEVYKGDSACDLLSSVDSLKEFKTILSELYGSFAIIIKRDNAILAAVDIARSMPLFYNKDNALVSDSAESIRKELGIDKESVNYDNYLELYSCDYVFGHDTVYSQINQLNLGELLSISENELRIDQYFKHLPKKPILEDSQCKKEILDATYKAFYRLKEVIGNRPVLISMSGGYDSRFVGCMLKNVGITDVSCYTYGKKGIFEVTQSKKNADALGFRWTCVELTDDIVARCADDIGEDYWDSYTGHDFTAYMQNFPAVRKLHEDGWIKPGSVVITGLCGDMPTGEYVFEKQLSVTYNYEWLTDHLYDITFTRYKMPPSFVDSWKKKVMTRIKDIGIDIVDYESAVRAFQCIYTETCHVHWFMHMNSVHSFFGYEWLLPYWDRDILNVWYRVPTHYLRKQVLYEDILLNDICAPYGLGQKKTIAGYSSNIFVRKLMYKVGSIFAYLFLHLGIPFKRGAKDYLNQAPLELAVYKKIPYKGSIEYERAGLMHLVNQYLLQKRYGINNMKNANKVVKTSNNYL